MGSKYKEAFGKDRNVLHHATGVGLDSCMHLLKFVKL